MKVLLIIDSVDLYGKERANIHVARVLKDHGVEVIILINTKALDTVREEIVDFKTVEVPFPRNLMGTNRIFKYVKAFFSANRKVRELIKELHPDYILLPTEIAIAYLYPVLRSSDVKVIFRCGDSPLVDRKRGFAAMIYGWLWRNVLVKRIDKLVSNAKFIQNQIKKSGRKLNVNDALIYNYPPQRVSLDDGIVYKNVDATLRVGFMGRIVADKGVKELIEAVIACNREEFKTIAFIGGNLHVDQTYTAMLSDILERNAEYKDCIQFVGNVKNLDNFYENIDVMTVPSVYPEPMANVVTEAKEHHCLSIIYNLGGMPEIIEHKKTGYICEEVSVAALKKALAYYHSDREQIKIQGEAAFASIEYLGLSKEKFEDRWLKIFS